MRVLVTGGASCGKSAYAEDLCRELGGNLVYLAAMKPFGEEGARRVEKHRKQRAGKGFETIECYEDFSTAVGDERLAGATALLECLGNVVANELFDGEAGEADEITAESVCARISDALEVLATRCAHVIVVGNEVGEDGVSYDPETHTYQEVLGTVSRSWAASCDRVVECVAGVPNVLKA